MNVYLQMTRMTHVPVICIISHSHANVFLRYMKVWIMESVHTYVMCVESRSGGSVF